MLPEAYEYVMADNGDYVALEARNGAFWVLRRETKIRERPEAIPESGDSIYQRARSKKIRGSKSTERLERNIIAISGPGIPILRRSGPKVRTKNDKMSR